MSSGILPQRVPKSKNIRRLSPIHRLMDIQSEVRKIPGHKCGLPRTEDQINYVITGGLFVLLRRKFYKWLTVCPSDPDSKKYLKSSAQIHRERIKHFSRHFYMIHPFSKGRFFWEMLMIPVLLMLFCLIPLEMALEKVEWYMVFWKFVLDILSFIDIILFFFTGYYDVRKQIVVMNARQVAKRYIFSFFFFDLTSSMPYTLILQAWVSPNARRNRRLHLLKAPMLFKLVRMPTLTRYIRKFSEHKNLWSYYIKFVSFILWVWVLLIWTSCIVFGAFVFVTSRQYKENEERFYQGESRLIPMLLTCYDVVRSFMTVGITETQNISDIAMILEIIGLLFGSALNMVILAKVMQVFLRKVSSRNKYTSVIDEIDEYMKYKELPSRLREKVFNYVDFKFQRHIFREDDILHTLSSVLKEDILLHSCQTMIETVEFFKDLPTPVMLRLVTKLRSEIYLPNDVIVMAGYTGHAMYFIYTGTVAVYTSTGKEICHLEDGSHFGEIALVYNEPRVATVIAVRECEVFKLNRKDFQEAIEPFPELNRKIRELAVARMEKTMAMMQDQSVLTFDEDVMFSTTPMSSILSF